MTARPPEALTTQELVTLVGQTRATILDAASTLNRLTRELRRRLDEERRNVQERKQA